MYIFIILLMYTKYIFFNLCILHIYFIHKMHEFKNVYKICLAKLAVYEGCP